MKTTRHHPMRIVKNNDAKFATHISPLHRIQFRNVKFNRHHTKVRVKSYRASGFDVNVRKYVEARAKDNAQLRLIMNNGMHKKTAVQLPLKDAVHVLDKVGDKNIRNGMIFIDIAKFSIAELNIIRKLMPTYVIVDTTHKVIVSYHPDLFTYPGYLDFTVLNLSTQPVKLCIPQKPIDQSDLEKGFDFFALTIQPEIDKVIAIEQYPHTLARNLRELFTTLESIFPGFSYQAVDLEHKKFYRKNTIQGILKKVPTTYEHTTLCHPIPHSSSHTTRVTLGASGQKIALEGTYSLGIVDDLYDIPKEELQSILSHSQTDNTSFKIIRRENNPNVLENKKIVQKNNTTKRLQTHLIEKIFSFNEVKDIIKKVGYSNIDEERHLISLNIKDFTLHELQILHDLMPSFDFQDRQHNLMIPYKRLPQTKSQRSMCNLVLFERFDSLFPTNIFLTLPDMGDIQLQCSEQKKTITLLPTRPNLLIQSEIIPYISLIKHLFPHYQLQSTNTTLQSSIDLSSDTFKKIEENAYCT